MKQWLFSLGVFFLGVVIYTLVKEAWPEAAWLRIIVSMATFAAVYWTWDKSKKS